jgi:hypothetical protein
VAKLVEVKCPSCAKRLRLPPQEPGKQVRARCPRCDALFWVRADGSTNLILAGKPLDEANTTAASMPQTAGLSAARVAEERAATNEHVRPVSEVVGATPPATPPATVVTTAPVPPLAGDPGATAEDPTRIAAKPVRAREAPALEPKPLQPKPLFNDDDLKALDMFDALAEASRPSVAPTRPTGPAGPAGPADPDDFASPEVRVVSPSSVAPAMPDPAAAPGVAFGASGLFDPDDFGDFGPPIPLEREAPPVDPRARREVSGITRAPEVSGVTRQPMPAIYNPVSSMPPSPAAALSDPTMNPVPVAAAVPLGLATTAGGGGAFDNPFIADAADMGLTAGIDRSPFTSANENAIDLDPTFTGSNPSSPATSPADWFAKMGMPSGPDLADPFAPGAASGELASARPVPAGPTVEGAVSHADLDEATGVSPKPIPVTETPSLELDYSSRGKREGTVIEREAPKRRRRIPYRKQRLPNVATSGAWLAVVLALLFVLAWQVQTGIGGASVAIAASQSDQPVVRTEHIRPVVSRFGYRALFVTGVVYNAKVTDTAWVEVVMTPKAGAAQTAGEGGLARTKVRSLKVPMSRWMPEGALDGIATAADIVKAIDAAPARPDTLDAAADGGVPFQAVVPDFSGRSTDYDYDVRFLSGEMGRIAKPAAPSAVDAQNPAEAGTTE